MHHVRYFLAVSETLNLTKAAERCNVAQPALTRAIKALESELGGELLRRERALSHLTELGQRMLPMLRQCYESALSAKMIAASIRSGRAAPLSMAISHTVALRPFTPMLRELSRAFPGLALKLRRGSASEVAEFLKSGTAELAIAGPLDKTWSRLDAHRLFEQPFALVVSRTHKLAGRNNVEFKDLASETLLINIGGEMVNELRACLEANGLPHPATHEVTTQEDLLTLLIAGLGIAIIPVGALETSGLCSIPLKQSNLVRTVSVYAVAGRQRAIVCATLFNMLRAADWSFDTVTKQKMRAYRSWTRDSKH
jgi:DNA-binding transcriptional LysR family regulator